MRVSSAPETSPRTGVSGCLLPKPYVFTGGPFENALTMSWPLGRGKNRGGRDPPPSKWLGPPRRAPIPVAEGDLGTHSPYRNADLCPPVGLPPGWESRRHPPPSPPAAPRGNTLQPLTRPLRLPFRGVHRGAAAPLSASAGMVIPAPPTALTPGRAPRQHPPASDKTTAGAAGTRGGCGGRRPSPPQTKPPAMRQRRTNLRFLPQLPHSPLRPFQPRHHPFLPQHRQ